MIIKAISHSSSSTSSIQRLIDYIFDKDKLKSLEQGSRPLVVKQFLRSFDKDKWAGQFKSNDDNRTFNHSRRTVLRHEIMSFSPKSTVRLNDKTLTVLAKTYLEKRCPQSLGVCGIHLEGKDKNPHIHFIISGVGIDGRSTRISRKQFKEFKNDFQEFQKERFPELSDSIVEHSKKKSLSLKLTQKEQHMKTSRGVLSEKEQLSLKVKEIAKTCKSLSELEKNLKANSLKPYSRNGKLTGLWLGNRKFRLTTLGVGKAHLKQLTKEEERLGKLEQIKDGKTIDIGHDQEIS